MAKKQERKGRKKWKKIDRIGRVTIYKRGPTYHVYYRENGRSFKEPVGRSLNAARRTASEVNSQLQDERPSTYGFERISISDFQQNWLDYCRHVRGLAHHTLKRYRAAFAHFVEFTTGSLGLRSLEEVTPSVMEDFIRHMRSKTRTRNGGREKAGSNPGKHYTDSGIAFILATCRTAFEHAMKHHHLPPYSGNPCSELPIESMSRKSETLIEPFTPHQESDFYSACNRWQFGIFFSLASVGLRRDELRFLLISDVDWSRGVVHIRNKPELLWSTKTRRDRVIPIFPLWENVLRKRIASRKEGFVFLHEPFFPKAGKLPEERPAASFKDHREMAAAVTGETAEVEARMKGASNEELDTEKRRAVRAHLRRPPHSLTLGRAKRDQQLLRLFIPKLSE